MLKANKSPTILVRSCFWANQAKDDILKQACRDAGRIFVDISSLGKDKRNQGRAELPLKSQASPIIQGIKACRPLPKRS